MIEVSHLEKFYGDTQVLHGLNFSVEPNRICGFLGPNGSGKSTTMDILATLLGPSRGSVRICGHDVVKKPNDVKACIGYLPDNPPLYQEMTVRDFVDYSAKLRGIRRQARKKLVSEAAEACNITDVMQRIIGNLSKGYRQRVALCSALVHKPKVLVLDEPTEGLDPRQVVQIRQLIQNLAKDRTVILSSHILSEVQATCHDAIIINRGRIAQKVTLDTDETRRTHMYTFAKSAPTAIQWCQNQTCVGDAEFLDKTKTSLLVRFQEGSDATVAAFNRALLIAEYPVLRIETKAHGLEHTFFEILQSQEQMKGESAS